MNFHNPVFLWALPAAGLPILLHLLSLRRPRREPFSAVWILAEIQRRSSPRSRLRSALLAASRAGLIGLLILAYAGPSLDAPAAAGGSGLSLVVLLDASYSMGLRGAGKSRFEALKAEALALLRTLGPADRVAFSPFSDEPALAAGALEWRAPAQAAAALRNAELTSRGTDFGPPLRAALDLLSGAPGRRVALVLTDGARHGFPRPAPKADAGTLVLGSVFPESAANAFVRDARPSPGSTAAKPEISLQAAVAGERERESSADLWSGGRRLSAVSLRLRPEAAVDLSLPPPRPRAPAAWSGRVSLRTDALPADDEYFFSFRHPEWPRVLCLFGTPAFFGPLSGGYFLREFLGARGESLAAAAADFLELDRWEEADLGAYRAVILADFRAVDARTGASLEAFVRGGGGLWILPGGRTSPASYQSLAAWLPAEVGPTFESSRPYGISPEGTDLSGYDLERAAVARLLRLTPKRGAGVSLRTAEGAPLAVSGRWGAGRVILWASSLDAAATNLGVKPVFASLIRKTLEEAAPGKAGEEKVLQVRVGRPLVRTWGSEEAAPIRVRIFSPDGRTADLAVKNRRFEFPRTSVPGLYRVVWETREEVEEIYAVNLDRSGESDPAPEARPPWRVLEAGKISEGFRRAVYGRDLGPWALAGAVLLLLMEMILSLPWKAAAGVAAALLLALPVRVQGAEAASGDRFVWTQLKWGPSWDPYPGAHAGALEFLGTATSVLVRPARRELAPTDPGLFESPLVILAGRQAPPPLDEPAVRALRQYLLSGGMLWIEDVSGAASSPFDRWVRKTVPVLLPEAELKAIGSDHVLYKTFFLLRGPAGRVQIQGALEGVAWGGRSAVVYSRNDLLGAWAEDALGRPLLACLPGGEPQRHAARKLTLNILMYSLTGNYKEDAVHQPFLLQKLRGGAQ